MYVWEVGLLCSPLLSQLRERAPSYSYKVRGRRKKREGRKGIVEYSEGGGVVVLNKIGL